MVPQIIIILWHHIIIIILYPRVYNARKLKTERIKQLKWLEIRNVIGEAIVQDHIGGSRNLKA